jgi:hypothetical protein
MSVRPFATPLLLQKGKAHPLERIEFDDNFKGAITESRGWLASE